MDTPASDKASPIRDSPVDVHEVQSAVEAVLREIRTDWPTEVGELILARLDGAVVSVWHGAFLGETRKFAGVGSLRSRSGDSPALVEHVVRDIESDVALGRLVVLGGCADALPMTQFWLSAVGAAVELSLRLRHALSTRERTPAPLRISLTFAEMQGPSVAWRRLKEDIAAVGTRAPLFVGEPGVGKAAASLEWAGPGAVLIDGRSLRAEGLDAWTDRLRAALADRPHVVLAHIEALPPRVGRAVISYLDEAVTRVAATATAAALFDRSEIADWFDVRVHVPALSERRPDFGNLIAALTARYTGRDLTWMPDTVAAIAGIDWPKNLYSLAAVVRTIAEKAHADYVTANDIPAEIRMRTAGRRLEGLAHVEAQAIVVALRSADGNKSRAASRLGISRSTLYRKLRELGLER